MFLNTILPWLLVAVLAATVLYLRSKTNHRFIATDSPFALPWVQSGRNNETLRTAFWLVCIVIIVQLAVIAVLIQTRQEKEFVFVEFPSGGNHFVKIAAAGEDIQANELLTAASIRTYVYERETIDRQTEEIRYSKVRAKSAPKVWKDFEDQQRQLYKRKGLKRAVEISSERRLSENAFEVEYTVTDTIDGKKDPDTGKPWERKTHFEATVTYSFVSQETTYERRYDNPVGLHIEKWTRAKDTSK